MVGLSSNAILFNLLYYFLTFKTTRRASIFHQTSTIPWWKAPHFLLTHAHAFIPLTRFHSRLPPPNPRIGYRGNISVEHGSTTPLIPQANPATRAQFSGNVRALGLLKRGAASTNINMTCSETLRWSSFEEDCGRRSRVETVTCFITFISKALKCLYSSGRLLFWETNKSAIRDSHSFTIKSIMLFSLQTLLAVLAFTAPINATLNPATSNTKGKYPSKPACSRMP